MSKRRYYNNGVINKMFSEDDIIPKGFVLGVKSMSEEEKKRRAEKRRRTNLARYGVENPFQSEDVKKRIKESSLEKYGTEHPAQSASVKEKTRQTNLSRYGVSHPMQLDELKDRVIKSNIEKFGAEHPMKCDDIKEKKRQTLVERYGVDNPMKSVKVQEKAKQTNLARYGVENVSQSNEIKEKKRQTMQEHYGVDYPLQSKEIQDRMRQSMLSHYGVDNPNKSAEVQFKARQSNLEKYGTEYVFQSPEIKDRIHQICLERYGVDWACQRPEARFRSKESGPNKEFARLLEDNHISYEREFNIGSYSYDFKVNNTLIEIDPTATHNTIWSPFGGHSPRITTNYHFTKSKTAESAGYRCIHIFDWNVMSKVISLLLPRDTVYARKCVIREVSSKECDDFLNLHHLQNTCKCQSVRIGLFHDDRPVSIMTFGKPRYNSNYQYELLRYASSYSVTGGAERLFRHFIQDYNPVSIISYCNRAKFSGKIYERLEFKLKSDGVPSCHWYNLKTRKHFTDNFVRQHGADRLLGTDCGKGMSNELILVDNGFLPVYDCGQSTFGWER